MTYKLEDLNDKIKEYIIKKYNQTHSISDIEKELKVSRNTILSLLSLEDIDYSKSDATSFELDGERILVIADTHLGSQKENLSYIDKAYEMGIKNNVCACLHLGDIIQGEYDKTNKPIEYQLETLDKKYPKVNDFKTYLLLGNHDYTIFENNSDAKALLEAQENIVTLGYKKAYFNWCNYLYGMEHKVRQLNDEMLNEDVALNFIGHGHELKIKSQSKLKIPTLSDDIINQYNGAVPGFVLATLSDGHLNVDAYKFKDGNVKIKKKSYFTKQMLDTYKVK